jgi:hypothetical protein
MSYRFQCLCAVLSCFFSFPCATAAFPPSGTRSVDVLSQKVYAGCCSSVSERALVSGSAVLLRLYASDFSQLFQSLLIIFGSFFFFQFHLITLNNFFSSHCICHAQCAQPIQPQHLPCTFAHCTQLLHLTCTACPVTAPAMHTVPSTASAMHTVPSTASAMHTMPSHCICHANRAQHCICYAQCAHSQPLHLAYKVCPATASAMHSVPMQQIHQSCTVCTATAFVIYSVPCLDTTSAMQSVPSHCICHAQACRKYITYN